MNNKKLINVVLAAWMLVVIITYLLLVILPRISRHFVSMT